MLKVLYKLFQNQKSTQTKSSAGDKFETSRAMMQAEEERSKVQLVKAVNLKNDLTQIDINRVSDRVILGSLVFTNQGNYFLSIGLGKILVDGATFMLFLGLRLLGRFY